MPERSADAVIEGSVRLAGRPVADAVVMISAATVTYPEIAALTDDLGRFSLTCHGTGRATLVARWDQQVVSQEVDVIGGRTVQVELAFE
ncbi:MAG: hypothetical protein J5I93_20310 [Pirellulaceae bacterium]|nr:hypothetical protein [Pirellulaceae bacterium]